MDALTKLLELRNFNQITVNDLCEEAQIAKTTFYAHFRDKYDLLENWLMKSQLAVIAIQATSIEKRISNFVHSNGRIIKHMMENANSETLELICDFMLALLDMKRIENGKSARNIPFWPGFAAAEF